MFFPKVAPLIIMLFFHTILISNSTYAATNQKLRTRPRVNAMNQFLTIQNKARAALHMRPLVWDAGLARYADMYSRQRRQDCLLKHSNGPYGENIFWGSGDGWTPAEAALAWVVEKRWYSYRSNSCGGGRECGHYTQIVWKDTKKIGCARVTCFGGRGVFMTCNYFPPGNYIGEKPY